MRMNSTILVLLLAAPVWGDERAWKLARHERGKMSAEFPVKPEETNDDGRRHGRFLLSTKNGEGAYIASFQELTPEVELSTDAPKRLLDRTQNATVKSLQGNVSSAKDVIHAGKYPARDVEITAPDVGIYRARLIVTPARF
jgi:hypothetical protein